MTEQNFIVLSPIDGIIRIHKWKVKENFQVSTGQLLLLYETVGLDEKEIKRLKSTHSGLVRKRLFKEGDCVRKGEELLELATCSHTTVIKDMCADCGADLRQNENGNPSEASVPMIHSVPELKVTQKRALELGQADTERLLQDTKLVLLVDLDQTLIHTTNDNIPNNLKDVYHFQLYGPNSPWYHTRLRPGTAQFLENMAPFYELHICTFGARDYAHTIATFLDEQGKFFSHRILSRDECFNLTSKTDNLKALFPCGDSMVCIIDDREDVWNMASNLIQVKPYHFFQHTGDINAPPGLSKNELDGKGIDFTEIENKNKTTIKVKTKSESVEDDKKDNEEKNKTEEKNETQEITEKENVVIKEKTETVNEEVNVCANKSEDSTKKELEKEDGKEATIKSSDDEMKSDEIAKTPDIDTKDLLDDVKLVGTLEDDLIVINDPDDYLMYLEEILKRIHTEFYKIYKETNELPDLKMLVPQIRSQILVGTHLVFSGLVPNHMKLEQSKAYQIAKSLGANVQQNINDDTTHLVAVTAGTIKFNTARKKIKIHIVTPDWLWSCAERWERVEERIFPLDPKKPSKMRQPPPHCHSPEHATNYNSKFEQGGTSKKREIEPKFVDTINPLLKFSNDELEQMNEEFEEFFESSSSSDDEPIDIESPPINKNLKRKRKREKEEEVNLNFFTRPDEETHAKEILGAITNENSQSQTDKNNSSSSDDEIPSAKFRRGGDLPSDLDMGSDQDSVGSDPPIDEDDDGDWNMMGAALEREFLGLDQ